MSSKRAGAAENAMEMNKTLAGSYYNVALPALEGRQGAINASLAEGEPQFMQLAFQGQRAGLTEGLAARGGQAQSQLMASSKRGLSGGNMSSLMNPADIGAQLANALYGSKFQEGQANLDQQFNLMSMGLGGAGTAGSGALNAAGQQLGAINFLPGYNQTYANIVGAGALGAGIYGAGKQAGWWGGPTGFNQTIGPAGGMVDPYSVNPYQTAPNIGAKP